MDVAARADAKQVNTRERPTGDSELPHKKPTRRREMTRNDAHPPWDKGAGRRPFSCKCPGQRIASVQTSNPRVGGSNPSGRAANRRSEGMSTSRPRGLEKNPQKPTRARRTRGEHPQSQESTGRSGWAWEVRYRDPNKRDRSKTFENKAKAEAFAASVETDIDRGNFPDPRLGKKTFGDWAEGWLESRSGDIKPTTYISYEGLLNGHLIPAFGSTPLARIRPLDVQRFFTSMRDKGLSRSRLRQARQLASMILNATVENGYIGRNPVPREKLGGVEPRRDQHPLTFEEVHAVADAVPDR